MLSVSVFGFRGLNGLVHFDLWVLFVWARKCFYSLIEGFEKYWGFEYCIYCVAGSPGLNLVNHGELQ